jgi:hypothetical protein
VSLVVGAFDEKKLKSEDFMCWQFKDLREEIDHEVYYSYFFNLTNSGRRNRPAL